MNESTIVRLIKQLDVTDLSGEKVMIDFSTGKYFLLKGAANEIWDFLTSAQKDGLTIGSIRDKLLEVYDIDADTCLSSVTEFLGQMKNNGFVELI